MVLTKLISITDFVIKSTAIELVTALSPCDRVVLEIARIVMMRNKPHASKHLEHYLSGEGRELHIDACSLLNEDSGVRMWFCEGVCTQLDNGLNHGQIAIPQWAYSNQDWLYALGGIKINWFQKGRRIVAWFINRYRWHPTDRRLTQRVHEAAENLKARGAKEFDLVGSTVALHFAEIRRLGAQKKCTPKPYKFNLL